MSSNVRAIQCFVDRETHRTLKTLAAQRDTTISEMVRTSVAETLRNVNPQQEPAGASEVKSA